MDNEKDKLENLFRDRFQNEELPIPEGMWERMRPKLPTTPNATGDAVSGSISSNTNAAIASTPWVKIISALVIATFLSGVVVYMVGKKSAKKDISSRHTTNSEVIEKTSDSEKSMDMLYSESAQHPSEISTVEERDENNNIIEDAHSSINSTTNRLDNSDTQTPAFTSENPTYSDKNENSNKAIQSSSNKLNPGLAKNNAGTSKNSQVAIADKKVPTSTTSSSSNMNVANKGTKNALKNTSTNRTQSSVTNNTLTSNAGTTNNAIATANTDASNSTASTTNNTTTPIGNQQTAETTSNKDVTSIASVTNKSETNNTQDVSNSTQQYSTEKNTNLTSETSSTNPNATNTSINSNASTGSTDSVFTNTSNTNVSTTNNDSNISETNNSANSKLASNTQQTTTSGTQNTNTVSNANTSTTGNTNSNTVSNSNTNATTNVNSTSANTTSTTNTGNVANNNANTSDVNDTTGNTTSNKLSDSNDDLSKTNTIPLSANDSASQATLVTPVGTISDSQSTASNIVDSITTPDSVAKKSEVLQPDSTVQKTEKKNQWRGKWIVELNTGASFAPKINTGVTSASGVNYDAGKSLPGMSMQLDVFRKLRGNLMVGAGVAYQRNAFTYNASQTRTEQSTSYKDTSYMSYTPVLDSLGNVLYYDSTFVNDSVPTTINKNIESKATSKLIAERWQLPIQISYQWRSGRIGMYTSLSLICTYYKYHNTMSYSDDEAQSLDPPAVPSSRMTFAIGGSYGVRYFFNQHCFISGRVSYQSSLKALTPKTSFGVQGGIGIEF